MKTSEQIKGAIRNISKKNRSKSKFVATDVFV